MVYYKFNIKQLCFIQHFIMILLDLTYSFIHYLTWFCKNNLPWFNQGCLCLFKIRILKRNFEAVVIKGWFYDLLLPELNFIFIWIWILSSNFQLYTPEMIRFFRVARHVEMGLNFKNLIFYFSWPEEKLIKSYGF